MEDYQKLNRELIQKIIALRSDNRDLQNTVVSLNEENMQIKGELSSLKKKRLQEFTAFSEILKEMGSDLYDAPQINDDKDGSKVKCFSMGNTSQSPVRKPLRSCFNFMRRPIPPEVADDDNILDMSIEDVQEWLKSDDVELKKPQEDFIKEESKSQEIAAEQQDDPVTQEQEIAYKNMTTITEESSQIQISIAGTSQSTHHSFKFASSTPCGDCKVPKSSIKLGMMSPIQFPSNSSQMISEAHEESLKDIKEYSEVKEPPKVTIRRGRMPFKELVNDDEMLKEADNERIREVSQEPLLETSEPQKDVKSPPKRSRRRAVTPISYAEESLIIMGVEDPEGQEVDKEDVKMKENTSKKRGKVAKENGKNQERAGKKKMATILSDKTNLLSPIDTHKPIKVENFEDIDAKRPKRRAAPENLAEPRLGTKLRRK